MESTDEIRPPADLKACMNFKWTDDLTLQFILYRHERRNMFTKKRNTSRHGWQLILRDMGLSSYVTPYQAQKKWNNLWSKYKLSKRAQAEGSIPEDDPNGAWPFFTVLDAISTGKTVAITSHGTTFQSPPLPTGPSSPSPSSSQATGAGTTCTPVVHTNDAPPSKKTKLDTELNSSCHWEGESEDHKQQIVELLQANLHQLDEVRQSIETQGQAIVSMLSQLINVISNGNKYPQHHNPGTSRIDEAITATIKEIGIPQDNV